jgi:outer membrane protein assembly factor BamB
VALVLGAAGVPSFPRPPPVEEQGPVKPDVPTPEEWARQWPVFRGPTYCGLAQDDKFPTQWDGAKDENIRWKTHIPLGGASSPVVWGKRAFVTGANKEKRELYCLDADSGQLLWKTEVKDAATATAAPPKVFHEYMRAASTSATDGRRVYAIFATMEAAAFTVEGAKVWLKPLGPIDSKYGYAASLALWRDRLIIQMDQTEEDKSVILALETTTGRVLWRTRRPVMDSWASPIVVHADSRDELVTCAKPWVIAYNPENGRELWRANCLDGDVAPTPVISGGLIFTCNVQAKFSAIRPGGSGDVSKTHVAWSVEGSLPDTVSPLAHAGLVYLVDNSNLLTCYDAANGSEVWNQAFDNPIQASPSLVGNSIYLLDQKGVMHILKAGRQYRKTGEAALGEEAYASPAFVGGRIYIRGEKHLFCIGSKE